MSCLGRDRTFGQSVLQDFANQFRHALAEHLCSLAKPSLLIGIEPYGQRLLHALQCKTMRANRSIREAFVREPEYRPMPTSQTGADRKRLALASS